MVSVVTNEGKNVRETITTRLPIRGGVTGGQIRQRGNGAPDKSRAPAFHAVLIYLSETVH